MDSQGRQVSVCRWYVYDGLGSVVGEVDPAGSLTSSPKYDVYGAVRGNPGTASSRQGFVGGLGHVSDTETGLVYMRARYYDPSNGRFNSEDPGRDGNNWFVYCADNPVNMVDVDGKYIPGMGEIVGAILILIGGYLMKGNPTLGAYLMILGFIALIGFATYDYYEYKEHIDKTIKPNMDKHKQEQRDLEQEIDSSSAVGGDAGVAITLHIITLEAALAEMDVE